jgi:hypothetical protein
MPRPSTIGSPARTAPARLVEAWLAIEAVRVAVGLNTWEGVEYIDRDQFEDLLAWAVRLDGIGSDTAAATTASADIARRLSAAAETAGYRVDRLRATLAAPPEVKRPAVPRKSGA